MKGIGVFALSGLAIAITMTPLVAWAKDGPESLYGVVEGGVGFIKQEGTTFIGPVDETDKSGIVGGAVGVRSSVGQGDRFVVGLEAGGDLYTDPSEWRYGVYGIAGWKTRNEDLAYIRLGYGGFSGDTLDLDGMVLGAGYELALNERTSLRFDYRSLFYEDVNFTDNSIDYHGHEITTALVFRPWGN